MLEEVIVQQLQLLSDHRVIGDLRLDLESIFAWLQCQELCIKLVSADCGSELIDRFILVVILKIWLECQVPQMQVNHVRNISVVRSCPGVGVDQIFSDAIDPKETGPNQNEQADTGKDKDLSFQLGAVKDASDGTIGHEFSAFLENPIVELAIAGSQIIFGVE